MEVVVPLAGQLVQMLTPFLPSLLAAGEKLGSRAADHAQAEGWEVAQKLWARLGSKIAARPAAHEAATDLAAQPADPDAQAALRVQLRKLLLDDPSLRQDIEGVLNNAQGSISTTTVTVSGQGGVGIGGSVQGSTIITGGQHTSPPGSAE